MTGELHANGKLPNLLPPLSPAEFDALKADIAVRGVQIPIELDADTGEIVDGVHRKRAADELGLDAPTVSRRYAREADRQEQALKLNLLRRQLDDEGWAAAFEQLAAVRGLPLGRGARTDLRQVGAGSFDSLAAELGTTRRTAQRRRQNARRTRMLRESGHIDLVEKIKTGELPVRRAERLARERDAATRAAEQAALVQLPATVDLRTGDFRDVLSDLDRTVDAIICDPPYDDDWVRRDAADFAAVAHRLLKPSGQLVVMFGHCGLYDLKAHLDEHLTYRWTCAYLTPGSRTRHFEARVGTGWKPVLVYRQPGAESKPEFLTSDVFVSDAADKTHHRWGQSESGMSQLVEAFSRPGDLVVDPFLGGGTTAVAANRLARRFVGTDVDPTAIATTRLRLNDNDEREGEP